MKDPQFTEALDKMRGWCSRQERSKQEVRSKLMQQGVDTERIEKVIERLAEDNYINEIRFAEAFVTGHFRMKRWGRIKIKHALNFKGIGEQLASTVLNENIDEQEYEAALIAILSKKVPRSKWASLDYPSKQKLMQYAYSRGFESDLIRKVLERLA